MSSKVYYAKEITPESLIKIYNHNIAFRKAVQTNIKAHGIIAL